MKYLTPIFPCGMRYINSHLAVEGDETGTIWYYHGIMPIFSHHKDDLITFKMFAAQLCAMGAAKQSEIVKTFGLCRRTLIRAVALYREKQIAGFYEIKRTRGPSVLSEEVVIEIQALLNDGHSIQEIAKMKKMKQNTLEKAVRKGVLYKEEKEEAIEKKKSMSNDQKA